MAQDLKSSRSISYKHSRSIKSICNDLKEAKSNITGLNLDGRQLTRSDVGALQHLPESIEELHLENCNVDDALATILREKKIKKLYLKGNVISNEGARVLFANPSIEVLDLSKNALTYKAFSFISENKTLKVLYLNENTLPDSAAIYISQNISIETLYLKNNQISDQGARALANNKTLKRLNLKNNKIGSSGAEAFSKNSTLDYLNIKSNLILLINQTLIVFKNKIKNLRISTEKYLLKDEALELDNIANNEISDYIKALRVKKNELPEESEDLEQYLHNLINAIENRNKKGFPEKEALVVKKILHVVLLFLNGEIGENSKIYQSIIKEANTVLDSFPWVGSILAFLAILLIGIMIALTVSLFVTAGPIGVAAGLVVSLLDKLISAIAAINIFNLVVGVTAATGAVAGVSGLLGGVCGFFGVKLIKENFQELSFKKCMENIQSAVSLGQ